jgi:CTP synthase
VIPCWFGDRGIEWMINIANFCREKNVPFLWLCLGLQIATIAFARNVCNIVDANSSEFKPDWKNSVIDTMFLQKNLENKWPNMRLWSYNAILKTDTKVRNLYKEFNQIDLSKNLVVERYRHRFAVNPKYHDILQQNWLVISWISPDALIVEFIEFPNHKYYVATQAHPEFKSRINKPHPLFLWLIKSVISQ